MKTYFSFGQAHIHPKTKESLKDYWVEVEAHSTGHARELINKVFGNKWSMQYLKEEFKSKYFPKGCLMTLNVDDHEAIEGVIEEMKEVPEKEKGQDNTCKGHTLSEVIKNLEAMRATHGELSCFALKLGDKGISIFIDERKVV